MQAIHGAVGASCGLDAYTGKPLRWESISTYCNDASSTGRRLYKKGFGDLPTVDHIGDGLGPADFCICGWRTNDSKNDLTYEEFVTLCEDVLRHRDRVQAGGFAPDC